MRCSLRLSLPLTVVSLFIIIHVLFRHFLKTALHSSMLSKACRHRTTVRRLTQMAQQTHTTTNGDASRAFTGLSLSDLPKSNVFTTNLPPDPDFPTPAESFKANRRELGPRIVKGALYTYVRPEEKQNPELFGVGEQAMRDIGLNLEEAKTDAFKQLVAGNKIMWDPEEGGIYPWAQCYGGKFALERYAG